MGTSRVAVAARLRTKVGARCPEAHCVQPVLSRRMRDCTQYILTSDHIRLSMPHMQNVIGIRSLRRRVSESLVRVGRGETIVVVRHGRPIAIIRPLVADETAHRISVTTFRRNLRLGMTT